MTTDVWKMLALEFPPDLERNFQGRGGKTMTYIEPRDVMDRLDEVLTPAGWQFEARAVNDTVAHGRLTIKVADEWIAREDFGYPNNTGDDHEQLKEAESDALRRCAMGFGVARYLYRRDSGRPQRPAQAPRTDAAARQAQAAPTDETYPWDETDDLTQQAQQIFPDAVLVGNERTCPDHGFEWKHNSRGFYCSGVTNGAWCKRKPSIAWAAAANAEWAANQS